MKIFKKRGTIKTQIITASKGKFLEINKFQTKNYIYENI